MPCKIFEIFHVLFFRVQCITEQAFFIDIEMTAKSDDGIAALSSLLQRTEVAQLNVVSFKDRALKLDKAEDADCIVKAIESASDLQVNLI